MEKKCKVIKDIRGVRGELDINDALRLAVEDERFARALVLDPEKLAPMFGLREIEVAALRTAVGDLGTKPVAEGWYE